MTVLCCCYRQETEGGGAAVLFVGSDIHTTDNQTRQNWRTEEHPPIKSLWSFASPS